MKIYLAAPFGTKNSELRKNVELAATILENRGFEVYKPWTVFIPGAWDLANDVWGFYVYNNDIRAINEADIVVVLSYGREQTTAGTNWEAGYAFGIGKKVVVVEMTNNVMSLMLSNGCYASISGLEQLKTHDFNLKVYTSTEQK